jgi:rubrerythrin
MPADPRMLELLSYYRDAELHGATLLMRLLRMMKGDADAQIKLTRHVADETRHAWLWTKRMKEIGGAPVEVAAGYQTQIGMRTMPRTLADLLALTIVVEERSLLRYREHAARSNVDDATRKVLYEVAADEEWHVAWITEKLDVLTRHDPTARERVGPTLARYREIDHEVYRTLLRREREVFGEGGRLAGGCSVSPNSLKSSSRASCDREPVGLPQTVEQPLRR